MRGESDAAFLLQDDDFGGDFSGTNSARRSGLTLLFNEWS